MKHIDRRTVNRRAARELETLDTVREHRCDRRHANLLDFALCAVPGSRAQAPVSGEFVVIVHCTDIAYGGSGPTLQLFRSLTEAGRVWDQINGWNCWSPNGCHGYHSIAILNPA